MITTGHRHDVRRPESRARIRLPARHTMRQSVRTHPAPADLWSHARSLVTTANLPKPDRPRPLRHDSLHGTGVRRSGRAGAGGGPVGCAGVRVFRDGGAAGACRRAGLIGGASSGRRLLDRYPNRSHLECASRLAHSTGVRNDHSGEVDQPSAAVRPSWAWSPAWNRARCSIACAGRDETVGARSVQ
jgi:hypothetical protein